MRHSSVESSGTQNTVYSTNCILEYVTAVLRLVEHKTLCIVQTAYWNTSQQC